MKTLFDDMPSENEPLFQDPPGQPKRVRVPIRVNQLQDARARWIDCRAQVLQQLRGMTRGAVETRSP